jgi:hypothetical protein
MKDDVVAFLTCGVPAMLSPLFIKTQSSKIEKILSKIKCYVGRQNLSL